MVAKAGWLLLFLAGLTWSTAKVDVADTFADQVMTMMNNTAPSMTQSYRLPGFDIQFDNAYKSTWNVQDGRSVSTGKWVRAPKADWTKSGGYQLLSVPFHIYEFRSNYTFHCSDRTRFPSTFEASMTRDYFATIQFKINYLGPFNCSADIYRIDLSEIPNCTKPSTIYKFVVNQRQGDCAFTSWQYDSERYQRPFRTHFCASYLSMTKTLIHNTAQAAIEGFNFCPL